MGGRRQRAARGLDGADGMIDHLVLLGLLSVIGLVVGLAVRFGIGGS